MFVTAALETCLGLKDMISSVNLHLHLKDTDLSQL